MLPDPHITIYGQVPIIELPGRGTLLVERSIRWKSDTGTSSVTATASVECLSILPRLTGCRPLADFIGPRSRIQDVFKVDPAATAV